MGFTGFTCAKTNLPILNCSSFGGYPETYEVVLLTKDGSKIFGDYDGYGRLIVADIGQCDVGFEALEKGTARLVLKKFYQDEVFDQIKGKTRYDPGQGHFHDIAKIREWQAAGGFKTFKQYQKAYNGLS